MVPELANMDKFGFFVGSTHKLTGIVYSGKIPD